MANAIGRTTLTSSTVPYHEYSDTSKSTSRSDHTIDPETITSFLNWQQPNRTTIGTWEIRAIEHLQRVWKGLCESILIWVSPSNLILWGTSGNHSLLRKHGGGISECDFLQSRWCHMQRISREIQSQTISNMYIYQGRQVSWHISLR